MVGVIGAGKISEQYLANMAQYPDLDVRFVADLFPDRARAQADAYGVPDAGTVEEALARDDIELIVNLTIPAAHAPVASAAIASGKHVWNEKPIASERDAAAALVAQADAAGLLVGTAPDTFLGPGLQVARQMIERGDIGQPLTASRRVPVGRTPPMAPESRFPLSGRRWPAVRHGALLPDRAGADLRSDQPGGRVRLVLRPDPGDR